MPIAAARARAPEAEARVVERMPLSAGVRAGGPAKSGLPGLADAARRDYHSSVSDVRPDTVIYDGDCPLCRGALRRLSKIAPPGSVSARSFREHGVLASYPGLDAARVEEAVHVVTADGEVLQGAAAILELARHRWWGRLLSRARRWKMVRRGMDAAYRWVARNRHRARWALPDAGRRSR